MKTVETNQVVCNSCEEVVHRYAVRCPYCNHDLKAPKNSEVQATLSDMISQSNNNPKLIKVIPDHDYDALKGVTQTLKKPENLPPPIPEETEKSPSLINSFLKFLFPLTATLAGSFFFFFGLFLKLFSKNGKLSLEWNAESWPYYVFPALIMLIIGFISFSSVDEGDSE